MKYFQGEFPKIQETREGPFKLGSKRSFQIDSQHRDEGPKSNFRTARKSVYGPRCLSGQHTINSNVKLNFLFLLDEDEMFLIVFDYLCVAICLQPNEKV